MKVVTWFARVGLKAALIVGFLLWLVLGAFPALVIGGVCIWVGCRCKDMIDGAHDFFQIAEEWVNSIGRGEAK